jgi:hypothetical protein
VLPLIVGIRDSVVQSVLPHQRGALINEPGEAQPARALRPGPVARG